MLRLVLVLLMVSAMPSSAESSLKRITLEQYLDSNARYRSTRHHYGRRSHTRLRRSPSIYEPSHPSLPPPEVARANMGAFDGKYDQPPVRWWDVDVSTVLKPMDFVSFPSDPGTFKLPDPPLRLYFYDVAPKWYYTFSLFVMLIITGSGVVHELRMARTCHKRDQQRLRTPSKRPSWMPLWIWRKRDTLRNLT